MATLQLNVLGTPTLLNSQGQGQALACPNKKTFGLLVYIAMQPNQIFNRDELANLLWPDSETPQARQSLRQALQELRKQFPQLELFRMSATQTLQIPAAIIDIDALTFQQLLQTRDVAALNQAMLIYRGDFMQGFTSQADGFDHWIQDQRRRLQTQRHHSLQSQATLELHAITSALGDTQKIISACLLAAQIDLNNRQYHTALRFLDRAEGLNDDPQTHFAISLQRGCTLLESNAPVHAIAMFEQAFKLTPDPVQQAQALIGMARGLIARKQFAAANQLLDRALAVLANSNDYSALAQLHFCRGTLHRYSGQSDSALSELRLAVKFAELAGDALWLCRTLHQLAATSLHFNHFRSVLTYTERCLRHAHTHNLEYFETPCVILRGQAQLSQNRLHDSFLELEYALSLAKRDDDIAQQSLTLLHLAELSLWQDRHATALAYSDKALQSSPTSALSAVIQAMHVLAEHRLHKVHEDDDRIDKAYMQSLEYSDPACSALILAILSRITADPQRRQWAWQEAERLLAELPACLDSLRCYQYAIEAAISHQHWEHARRFAKKLHNSLSHETAPFYTMFAKRAHLLAMIGEGNDNTVIASELEQLRELAYDLNLLALLPAYENAQQILQPTMDSLT